MDEVDERYRGERKGDKKELIDVFMHQLSMKNVIIMCYTEVPIKINKGNKCDLHRENIILKVT